MLTNNNEKLRKQTEWHYLIGNLKHGAMAVAASPPKAAAYMIVILILGVLYLAYGELWGTETATVADRLTALVVKVTYPIIMLFALPCSLLIFGIPRGAKDSIQGFKRIGLVNRAGETPLLLRVSRDKACPRVLIMEYDSRGIPAKKWEDMCAEIEAILNMTLLKVVEGNDKRTIRAYVIPASVKLPDKIDWRDAYLPKDNFSLALGESLLGRETVNLATIPHMLLGGSTGSGKSVLLRLLLYQARRKGALVFIADFKGGIDFGAYWHDMTDIIVDIDTLIIKLDSLVAELERRKRLLKESDAKNIDEHNAKSSNHLRRIVFACDEVAEVLDKTGLDKAQKEAIAKVEAALSTIARQGRAMGIHLILATQRPDANVIPGQIKANIDCRICGRADNTLSIIILDNADANDKIPKDARGRFLRNDGTVFQGYWFDDSMLEGW